ncbi:copper chaperone [Silvimonas amylolytica]|uniref:Metal-binding integral membrane protein DUF2182 n=1 Tax=Silvimonas amylolytica TaxID=449663 RepID=A0ABQ2PIP9_9NEIS|nr:DUF2182 domain-containing protein [Silvimonas amylolytica]GGP25116.1 hypothetical protein GCM10010971_09350 [Silvimonas amylolytica]
MNALRQRLAWHPEWFALVLCLAAWSVLLAGAGGAMPALALCTARGVVPGHTPPTVAGGVLMLLAMMAPRWLMPLRHVAFRSLRSRRGRAMALFVLGWLMIWLLPAWPIGLLLVRFEAPPAAVMMLFVLAAVWQLTPQRHRALLRCHRTRPLALTGWRADTDCLRFGAQQGVDCLISCGPLMLALGLAPASLWAMLAASALIVAELRWPQFAGRRAALFTVLLGFATLV